MGSEKRVRRKHIMVRVSDEEIEIITRNSAACSLKNPAYLRSLGMGEMPKSTLDSQHIIELAKINGDLGRLGGLLKLWLLEKEGHAKSLDVPKVLSELRDLKKELEDKVSLL